MKDRVLLMLLLVLLTAVGGQAQILFSLPVKTNAVSFSSGYYHNQPTFSAGIARGVGIKIGKIINDEITLFLDFTEKTNFRNQHYFKFTYGGQGYLIEKKSFKLLVRKTFTLIRINDPRADATYLGGELELLPGIYKDKYFAALHIYYGDSFGGHLFKRDSAGADIKTGWVKPKLSTIATGISAGYFFKKNLCVFINADFFAIKPKHALSPYPYIYEYAGVNYLF